MNADLHKLIERCRWQSGDHLLTTLTVLLLLMMFVVAPLQPLGFVATEVFGVIIAIVIVCGVLVLSGSVIAIVLMSIAFAMNVVVFILRMQHTPSGLDLYMIATAWLLIAAVLGVVVIKTVFGPGRVSYHRIVGAVLLYLLTALIFASLFVFVGLSAPGAFNGMTFEDSSALGGTLIYFSVVTLTSTGYGEIVPLHPLARSLCNLETIFGQLYPATLLARLVTLELQSSQ